MNKLFSEWLNISGELINNSENFFSCPCCGNKSIECLIVGDPKIKVGYAMVWCNNCIKGIVVSRLLIKDGMKYLSFEDDNKEILENIPNFERISPDDNK